MIIVFIILLIVTFCGVKSCYKHDLPKDPYVKLYLKDKHQIKQLRLEEYLVGCLAAEMPSSFDMEALKAQAVCARTYAIRKLLDNHTYPLGANLSDDIFTCQAYISEEEFYLRHPHEGQKLYQKVKKAVRETEGIIIMHKEEPIDALYHSTCGGQTASAQEAWGNDVAYLKSQSCTYCQASRHYATELVFSYQDFNKATGSQITSKSKVNINNHSSGRTSSVTIGNKKINSNRLRTLLNLPSNWMNLTTSQDRVLINTKGYGHGVGLCQYGANGLAREGYNYQGILKYYYTGVKIYKINY